MTWKPLFGRLGCGIVPIQMAFVKRYLGREGAADRNCRISPQTGQVARGLEKSDTHWHVVDMKTNPTEPMNASLQFCPNLECKARGQGGRRALEVWPELHIGTVIKRTVKKRLKEVLRQMTHGSLEQALKLLARSKGGTMLNTSFIERLNGTMRERLAALTRKCRHASSKLHAFHTGMYLIGCTYNLSWSHHALSQPVEKGGFGMPCTPAMASGLTDHIWSVFELLSYKVAPPPLPIPKQRGRPRTKPLPDPTIPKRPRGRPWKVALCSTTS